MAESIEKLRIYQSALKLEDQVYELVKALPEGDFYQLGNDLRRSSAAVSHHIAEAHKRYSYTLKLDSLQQARIEAEITQKHLEAARENGATDEMISDYTAVIKQCWGLIKYFKKLRDERQREAAFKASVSATDELVAARA